MVTAGGFDGGGPRPGPGRGPPWLVANRGTGASGARAVPAATGGCRRSDVPAQHPETAPGTRGRARVVGPAFLTAGAPRDSGWGSVTAVCSASPAAAVAVTVRVVIAVVAGDADRPAGRYDHRGFGCAGGRYRWSPVPVLLRRYGRPSRRRRCTGRPVPPRSAVPGRSPHRYDPQ